MRLRAFKDVSESVYCGFRMAGFLEGEVILIIALKRLPPEPEAYESTLSGNLFPTEQVQTIALI